MKLAYYFTRRQFGKVLTPLKVHSARLPPAFGLFYSKVSKLVQKLTLSPETVLLIRHQVARINICLFCIDIARSFTIKASMNQAKFDALDQYTTSPLFTDAERAALDYVTELTKDKKVNPDTFACRGTVIGADFRTPQLTLDGSGRETTHVVTLQQQEQDQAGRPSPRRQPPWHRSRWRPSSAAAGWPPRAAGSALHCRLAG
jgi:hypothetical protein